MREKLNDGIWEGTVNIADCVKSQEDPLPKIQLIADVNQRETYRPVSAIVEYDAYGSGFELIPLRPAYTEHTPKIFIYLNRLSYLPSILDDTVEVTDHCVSESKDANGKNRSIVGQKVGTIIEIDVDSKCKLYIIKARRKLMENVYSREELIVIPAIFKINFFNFNFIHPVEPTKPFYNEGETIEVNVPPDLQLNYLFVCNSKDVSSVGSITSGSRIMVPVKSNMNGQCVLYVYTAKDGIFQLDMYLFMVLALNCPEDYSLKLSLKNITAFSPLDVRLQAKRGSWAIVHGFDSRLEGLLRISSGAAGSKHWAFNEFTKPDERSSDLVWLSNFLRLSDFIQALKTSCHAAGKYAPQCPKNNFSSSRVSDICLRELKSGCNPSLKSTGSLMDRMQKQEETHISTMFNMLQPARHQRPPPNAKSTKNVVEEDLMNDVEEQSEQDSSNLIIRDYFPEVWLFEDYKLGDSGILTIPLKSPHSVTEWKFHAAFWTKGRGGMCQAPSQSVVTLKKIFMDVDLPQFTYSNETVQVRVTVSADNIESQTNMAVCFRGLSPVVCGDLGRDGTLGETDYTRILLNADQKIVVKSFYVRFLKEGLHNISFELREENAIPGGEWHCRDEDALIYDRILKQVQVNKRVDIEEHYRQLILYRTRKIDYPMHIARSMQPIVDVINCSQTAQPDGSVLTTIELNSQERVYNIDLEFAKYLPTISAYLGNDQDRSVLSSPMSKYARYKRRRRFQKSVSDNDVSSSYSLSNVIKELASVTYDLKVLKTASRVIPANEIEARENEMGNLLSELLTFSDCHTQGKECGFGEFTQPVNPDQRNILLTSIATSLLCEQSAAEEYVCGPLLFLAKVANRLGLRETIDLGYSTQLYFDNEDDRILFLQALLVNMVMDCGIYSCVNATGAWIQLHSDFYKVDESKNYDMRTEAAMAFVSTPIVRALLRRKLATKARVDKLPFWNIAADKYSLNSLDRSLTKSANVLVNSLALLAYTANDMIYRHWKTEFNFDDLANWLIEQQGVNRQFENAIDTYFGSRALYSYHLKQMPRGYSTDISGNITVTGTALVRQFDSQELPLSVSIPPTARSINVAIQGDGRLLLGVRVLTGRRRRAKRDPTETYPVTIKFTQSRNPFSLYLNQTVTVTTHSSMLKTIEIEHGLFTGFSSKADFVGILNGSGSFLVEPKISSAAIHFVLTNLRKEEPVTYFVALTEPTVTYSPQDMAPIAITAIHNAVMGRLIIAPRDLTFITATSPNTVTFAQHPGGLTRYKRENFGRPSLARMRSRNYPSQNDDPGMAGRGLMAVPSNLQTVSAELVETVCLSNGYCTCAESTCANIRCTNCSQLSFHSLCDELRQPTRFAVIFRIIESRSTKMNEAEYYVFDVKILDWYGDSVKDAPDQLTIWLRACNLQCTAMINVENNTKPRFLLIGNSDGFFDGSDEDDEVDELIDGPISSSRKSMHGLTQANNPKSLLTTNYVIRDTDRLAKSTDCWQLFGRLQDEQC